VVRGREAAPEEVTGRAAVRDTLSLVPRASPRAKELTWTMEMEENSRPEGEQAASAGTRAAEREDDTAIAEAGAANWKTAAV
jgi:hypothetical protein